MPANRSFWLKQALSEEGLPDDLPATATFPRGLKSDVCIVGGGFTGLWTALHLKRLQPSASVTIVERDICGGGASGRNAGFCMSWMSKAGTVLAVAGAQDGVRLLNASEDAIRRIETFCADNGIDCDFRNDGWVWAASNEAQRGSWSPTIELLEKHGLHTIKPIGRAEIEALTGSRIFLGAAFEAAVSTVQPAKLARGLRRVALERGVVIHEHTRMLEISRGPQPGVTTDRGPIQAGAVILALDAWAHEMPEFRRHVIPIAYDLIITEPAREVLEGSGLTKAAAVSDSRGLLASYRVTADGRVVFGSVGNDFATFGRVGDRFDRASPLVAELTGGLRRWLPQLSQTPIADNWRGPTTRSDNGLPHFGSLPGAERVFFGHGYTGNGIGPSYLGGLILASLALGLKNEWTDCALCRPLGRPWLPREPLRSIGGKLVYGAVKRVDGAADASRNPKPWDAWLASFSPKGLVPKKA